MGTSRAAGRDWRHYAAAVLVVAAGVVVRLAFLQNLGQRAAFVTLYPAVAAAALYGGLPAGLLATALSAAAACYYWVGPLGWAIEEPADWIVLGVFVFSGGLISWICEARRRAQSQAAVAEAEARVAVEKQHAAEELHLASEQARFLAEIIEKSEQPLGVGYPDGRLKTFNPALCNLTGYTEDELRNLNWAKELTPPGWEGAETAALAEVERTGKPVRYQKEYIRKDGTRVPIELLVHAGRDAAGKVEYYYSFITDITERQNAERALLASEARFRRLMKVVPIPLGFANERGELSYLNDRFVETFGYTHDDVPTMKEWWRLAYPDETYRRLVMEAWEGATSAAARTGADIEPAEYRVTGKNGTVRQVVISGIILHDGVLATFIDVTERKRAEEEVRRQREWLRVTLTSIGDAVLAADMEGKITFLNPVGAALTGWDEAQAMGRPAREIFRIINEQTREQAEDIIGRVLREGQIVLLGNHTALVSQDGREIPIEDSAAPIRDSAGNVAGAVVVFHDVAEKRRAQRALQRSEAQLQTILENLNEGLVVSTLEGETFLWNRAALEMHGFDSLAECRRKLPEFAGIFELSTMDGAVLPVEQWPLARILRGEPLSEMEIRIRRLQGAWERVFSYGGGLVRGEHGEPLMAIVSIRDITERKKSEQALRESEARLRALGDNLPEGAVFRHTHDVEGRQSFEFISAGIERLTGVPAAEAMRDAAALLGTILPEDLERLRTAEHLSREHLSLFEMELRQRHRVTGEVRWSLVRSMPQRRADGSTVWDGVQFDITERKRLEEQLRQRVEELETVMDVAPVAVWVAHDPQCREITGNRMANEYFEAAAGANVSANASAAWRYFQNGRELAPWELPIQVAVTQNVDVRNSEVEVLLPSGKRIHILGHASPLRDAAGNVRGGLSAFIDITERKQAEEVLHRSEAVYRAIARNIPDGSVAVVDRELRYRVVDGSLLARFGTSREHLEGNLIREAVDDPERARIIEELFRRAMAGESVDHEMTIAGREVTGRYVPLRDEQGVVIGAMSLWLDITDRKRSEEQLRQAQKLESIGLLAGGIAHDFNNLLTGILGNASLAMEDADPKVATTLRAIVSSAESAAHLTRQLLAYSGKGQFIVRNLHLTSAVREMADLLGMSIPKSIELRLDLRERLPMVAMDPGQFQQVVMNLVINAGEAVGEGNRGRILVTTGLEDVASPFTDAFGEQVAPGRYVYLEVADNGQGMDAQTKARIFDPFFTTKFTGRGLGLAAVSGIVRAQKGAITVKSAPGQGSVFRVYFRATQAGVVQPEPEQPGEGRRTVLVVDDEESVRKFLSMALRRYGYRVLEASDGSDALALCDKTSEPLDVVILDIIMPVMGGSEFLSEIRGRRPGLKVLLTSGYSEAEAKRLCAAFPGAAFIQKPYTAQQLGKAMEELLGPAGR